MTLALDAGTGGSAVTARDDTPRCPVVGCDNDVDPRFSVHDHTGAVVAACDGCGNACEAGYDEAAHCACPPLDEDRRRPAAAWHEAQQRRGGRG